MPPVRQADVDGAVLEHFQRHVIDFEATKRAFRERAEGRIARLAEERDAAARRYSEAKKKYERARELVLSGDFEPSDLADYRAQRGAAEAASNAALDRFNEARKAQPPDDLEALVAERLVALAQSVHGGLDSSEALAQQRAQLAAVFGRFTIFLGDADPARADDWPPGSPLGHRDFEGFEEDALDLDAPRLMDRQDDPEGAVALGQPDAGIAFTIVPELRSEVVEGWGLDCQPVAARVPLALTADPADAAGSAAAGRGGSPRPTEDSLALNSASHAASHVGKNNVEGLAT